MAFRSLRSLSITKNLKGGRLERWGDYWVNVANDYREVAVNTIKDIQDKPSKAAVCAGGIGGIIYMLQTNPNEREFKDCLQRYMNDSALLSSKIRNGQVDVELNHLVDCCNHGLLRRLSFGIFSVIWRDNYSRQCGIFKSQCSYLKPRYLTFHQRVCDVGCLGKWWRITYLMKYFDINPEEWNHIEKKAQT